MQFLIDNPMILLAGALVIMAFFAYHIVKPKKKQNESKSGKDDKKSESEKITAEGQETASDSNAEQEKNEDTEAPVEEKKEKKRLKKTKPEVSRVYEKKKIETKVETKQEVDKSKEEEELLKKMQFVKSGKVSRLKPYTVEEQIAQPETVEQQEISEQQEIEEFQVSSHFDRTRRLSKMIKEDSFDDMFCSHISDKYMNMDEFDRHIRNCDEIQEKLFKRAADTMANSESKVSIDTEGKIQQLPNRESMKNWLEERRRQELARYVTEDNVEMNDNSDEAEEFLHEELDLSARTVLIVDSLLNRKGKKSRKS